MAQLSNGAQIPLYPIISDPTGSITQPDFLRVSLKPGYYLVSYRVSARLLNAGYMQITPSYNGSPHLPDGIYDASETASMVSGSPSFIIEAASGTTLSLTYAGSSGARDGVVNLTILKLSRSG